jgi:hypothetical protein
MVKRLVKEADLTGEKWTGERIMIIGVPREMKTQEYRVALTPAGVDALVHAGHPVIIEDQAGQGSGFFINSGGDIITSRHVLRINRTDFTLQAETAWRRQLTLEGVTAVRSKFAYSMPFKTKGIDILWGVIELSFFPDYIFAQKSDKREDCYIQGEIDFKEKEVPEIGQRSKLFEWLLDKEKVNKALATKRR